jgi:steroid delta-isomerase-like uncharacterized protein
MMDRRQFIVGATMAGATLAPSAWARSDNDARGIIDQFAATLSAHDIDAFASLFADDYVNHQMSAAAPAPALGKTAKQATVDFFHARLVGIPNLNVSVEAALTSDDRGAASFVYTGAHEGPYFGIAATGRLLRFTSCDIFLIRQGQIAEHWGMGDIAGVVAQLKA